MNSTKTYTITEEQITALAHALELARYYFEDKPDNPDLESDLLTYTQAYNDLRDIQKGTHA